jgi:DNA-binding NtrC family response regulator
MEAGMNPQARIDDPNPKVPVLLVSPYLDDHDRLPEILNQPHWSWQKSFACSHALMGQAAQTPAIIFCEREQSDGSWQDLLGWALNMKQPAQLIVCARHADERLWAEVLNLGGYDLLTKPFDPEEVQRVTFAACRAWEARSGQQVSPKRKDFSFARAARMSGAA